MAARNVPDSLRKSFHASRLGRMAQLKISLPKALAQRFMEVDILTQSASLAFYALLSLAPMLVLILWLTASLYGSAQQAIIDQVGELAGQGAATVADTVIANADDRPGIGSIAGLWSTLLLLLGASAVFGRLQDVLNQIFRTDAGNISGVKLWVRKRLLSVGVVFALGFLLLLATTVTTLLQVIFAGLPSLLPVMGSAASMALYAFSFGLLYHFLPDRSVGWRQAFLGGVVTAGLFVLGRWGIGLYLAKAAPGSAYGSMGALVLLLVWMYYTAIVFFSGALITAVIDERARARSISEVSPTPPAPPAPTH